MCSTCMPGSPEVREDAAPPRPGVTDRGVLRAELSIWLKQIWWSVSAALGRARIAVSSRIARAA